MWPGLRKLLRWVGRIGLGVLALVLVGLIVALVVVHTDWGRELIRARVELVLRDVLPGGAKLGKIEGSPFTTLTIHDVQIDAMSHKPFVKLGSVSVSAAIWPLIRKTVHVESVEVDDVQLDPTAGPLVPPRPDDHEPLAWRIELPHVELHRISVDLGDPELAVRELELSAAVTIADKDIAGVAWLDTKLGDKRVSAMASVAIDGHGVRVPAALVSLDAGGGRARIDVTDLVVDLARPRGAVMVSAPASVVGVKFPVASQLLALGAPLGDVALRLELADDAVASKDPTKAPDATKIMLAGRAGAAKIDATMHAALSKLGGHGLIELTGLALDPLTRGTLPGPGAVLVDVDASLQRARVRLAVLPALVARPEPLTLAALDRADKALAASESIDAIAGELAGAGAPAGPRVIATAEVIRHGETWTLVAARAAGKISGASAAGKPVRGRVAFRVQAVAPREPAPLPKLAPAFVVDAELDGGVEVRGGGFAALSVSAAYAQFRGRITGKDLQLRGELAANGIANAGKPIGDVQLGVGYRTGRPIAVNLSARPAAAPISAEISASVVLGDVIRIELARLGLQLPGDKHWDGGGGVVTIGDRIALRGLALHHGTAALEVGGQFDPARGDLVAKVVASHIELSTLSPKLRGEGSSEINVERRGNRWKADVQASVLGLAAGKTTPPTDASLHLALAGDKLTIDASAQGADAGGVEVAIAVTPPRDPTDVAGWLRLDARAIHMIKIKANQLALGGLVERAASPADLAALDDDEAAAITHHSAGRVPVPVTPPADDAPAPAPVDAAPTEELRGTIDGEIDLAPTHPSGSLAIRGVGLPFGVLDGDVALAPKDGALSIKLDARMPDVAVAHVGAELAVPVHPLEAATWRDGGRSLLRQVDASVDKVRVNAAILEKLGIAQKLAARGIVIPYRATVAAAAHVGAGASDAKINLDITGVRGGMLVQSISQHLELTADQTGTKVHGELRGGGTKKGEEGNVPLGTLDATLAMTMAQWQATPRAALGAVLQARWSLADTDAVPILAIVDRHELTGGTLAIDAVVKGTPGAPIIDHADIIAKKLAARAQLGGHAPPVFDELRVSARMAGGAVGVSLNGHEASGGTIVAMLDAPLGDMTAAKGSLDTHQVDLAPIAAVLPGRFSAIAGTLDGKLDFAGEQLSGTLTVTGGALPIAPVIGTLHDASAKLKIDDKALHVELTGGLGGGAIKLIADAPPNLSTATATVNLDKVALLGSHRTEISADIGAKFKIAAGQVSGDLDVTRTRINVAPRTGVPLLEVDAPEDLVLPTGKTRTSIATGAPAVKTEVPPPAVVVEATARPTLVTLHVALGNTVLSAPDVVAIIPGVDVATVHANAHSDGGLDVSIGEQVAVVGRIDVDAGDVDFLGRRYLITPNTSSVTFDGSVDPLLAIQMAYSFPTMTLTADVRGRVSAPEPHLSSDTVGYSDDQLFAFFLGGSPATDVQSTQSDSTTDAATVALAKVASGALGRQVNKLLPVKIDSVACAPGTAAASKACTVGKQLSRRLYLYYSTRPTPLPNENTNEVELQYRLSNTTLLDISGGDRSYYSADLLSRHPW